MEPNLSAPRAFAPPPSPPPPQRLFHPQIADVLRGAVLSPVFAVDAHYAAAVSNGSPLFKLPVDAVQRGRDHGLPTYNDARRVRERLIVAVVNGPSLCRGG